MADASETELEKAERRFAQAKARVQALRARETQKERKLDARRKIILGGGLMERARRGDPDARQLVSAILGSLDREVDRKAFEDWNVAEGKS